MSASRNGWGPPALWASGVLVACLSLVPVEAHAAGCCGSQLATADRLSPDEWRSVSVSGSFASITGGFDAAARFHPLRDGYSERELRGGIALAHRLNATWQAGLSLGWLESFRSAAGRGGHAGGLDDTVVSARWDPEVIDAWAFTTAVILPTGLGGAESRDPLGADVTGKGAWGVRLGAAWEAEFGPSFLLIDGSVTLHGPARASDTVFSLLPQLSASYGRTFGSGAGVAGGLELTSQAGVWTADGREAGSALYLATLRGVGTWPVGRFSITGQVWVQPPVMLAGLSESARLGLGVGLRRAW